MLRMLDERVGLYNRGGAVQQELGVLVNTCKQCQKQWSAGVLTVGYIEEDFRWEIVYFGGSKV